MSATLFISILLAIVGFIGSLMVKQLMRIAGAVQQIQVDIKVLANDHSNLKEAHSELKKRVDKLEI